MSTENKSLILVGLLFVSVFFNGAMWMKVKMLEKNSGGTGDRTADSKQAAQPTQPEIKVDPVSEGDHVRGDRNAKIALIEYSDLECPFCKQFHKTAQRIVDEYDGQVMWVYRHFPLDNLHPKADKEAEAAECAGDIGSQVLGGFVPGNQALPAGRQAEVEADKFWAMTDKIFEVTPSNNGLNLEDLPKLAEEAGVDQVKFQECLDSGKFAQLVEDDYQSGIRAGVTGTPGNILLDTTTGKTKVIPGAVPFEQVKQAIDAML